ncbi:type II secretion system protein N [Alteromonadaceae bacterium M269]|nr:type II secretion system protein N [Alteromonadaceae bacterium M269]
MLKKRIQWAILAVFVYLVFLIIYLPAKHVINRIDLPQNTALYRVSGTIWNGEAQRAVVKGTELESVKWKLSFLPLITKRMSLDVDIGNIRDTARISAKGHISIAGQKVDAEDMVVYAPVSQLIRQFNLPFPVDAGGRLKVNLNELNYDQHCTTLSGKAEWLNASVNALNTAVDLDSMNGNLGCEEQQVTINIQQPNVLGLAAKAKIDAQGKFSIDGKFKPDSSLPPQITQAASILGQPDSEGFYPLQF